MIQKFHSYAYTPEKLLNLYIYKDMKNMIIAALIIIASTGDPQCPSTVELILRVWNGNTMEWYTGDKIKKLHWVHSHSEFFQKVHWKIF